MNEPIGPTLESRLEVPPPEGTLLRIFHSMGLFRQIMEPYFAKFGISGPQWAVLRILEQAYHHGEHSLPQKEISRRLLIQPPSVTALVDRLERLGLLQRSPSDDLRVRMVGLTDPGRKLIAKILENHPAHVRSLFSGLTPAELGVFHDLLGKLGAHLTALAADAQLPPAISTNNSKAKPRPQRSPNTQ